MVERRVELLETDVRTMHDKMSDMSDSLARVEQKLDTVLPHLATGADVEKMGRTIVMWMVGAILAATALAFTIARFLVVT